MLLLISSKSFVLGNNYTMNTSRISMRFRQQTIDNRLQTFNKNLIALFLLLALFSINIPGFSNELREEVEEVDPSTLYDEILNKNSFEKKVQNAPMLPVEDAFVSLLPKLNDALYSGWSKNSILEVWEDSEDEVFFSPKISLLQEVNLKKVIRQKYSRGEEGVQITIYNFEKPSYAYSIYSTHRSGALSNLKIGKDSAETAGNIDFWKGKFYVHASSYEGKKFSRGFALLASQEIAQNIKSDTLPPTAILQIPSLNKVRGTEKFCLGLKCINSFFPNTVLSLDPGSLKISSSEGAVIAKYGENEKESSTLLLIRYLEEAPAKEAIKSVLNHFAAKAENKEVKLDTKEDIIKVKYEKNDYTLIKQKGELIAILFNASDRKEGESLLNLLPWPM